MTDLECGLCGVVGPDRLDALLLRLRSLCDAAPLADSQFKYHDQVYIAGASPLAFLHSQALCGGASPQPQAPTHPPHVPFTIKLFVDLAPRTSRLTAENATDRNGTVRVRARHHLDSGRQ